MSQGQVGPVLLVILAAVAFCGLAIATTRVVCGPGPSTLPRGEPSWWMVAASGLCLLVLAVLGVHPPAVLNDLLQHAAIQVAGGI